MNVILRECYPIDTLLFLDLGDLLLHGLWGRSQNLQQKGGYFPTHIITGLVKVVPRFFVWLVVAGP